MVLPFLKSLLYSIAPSVLQGKTLFFFPRPCYNQSVHIVLKFLLGEVHFIEDQQEQQEQKFREMTQAPVGRLVGRLAFPCIISMLVTAFYNMADTFFVGMMDNNAATGFFSALAAGALLCLAG